MNIRPYIIINNVNSQSIPGLLISELPPISKPQQRTRIEEIDGRDGDLVTPLGYAAYDKTVKIGLTYGYDIDEIIEYFNSEGVVIFSNEPDKYYRFAIYEQIDFEKLIRFKSAEVVFHCQPFKFSTTEEPLLFDVSSGNPITVTNSGNTISRPNLLILGNDEIDVSLNGSQILTIDLSDEDQAVIINAEDMNAYAAESAIKEVIAEINPVQDLHGQDYPYPAGGGKNKMPDVFNPLPANNTLLVEYPSEITLNGLYLSFLFTGKIGLTGGAFIQGRDASNAVVITFTFNNLRDHNGNGLVVDTQYTNELVYLTFSQAKNVKRFYFFRNWQPSDDASISQFMLSNTTTATPYAPYENICPITGFTAANITRIGANLLGEVYNIPFVDDQGDPITVYGVSLNVTTGLLTIDRAYINYDGSETWTMRSDGSISTPIPTGLLSSDTSGITNMAVYDSGSTVALGKFRYGASNFIVNLGSFADVTEAKNYLASHNLQFVYPLATPQEVQLTPTQINNLLGENNLYSDTNGDITVTFSSDGVIQTETGDIVTFTAGAEDMTRGVLLNRLITGNYDKIRLKKGENTLSLTGGAQQLVIDNYSRWL